MKKWLIIGGLGAAYLAYKAVGLTKFVENLRYSIKNFSFPYIQSGHLVFPIVLAIDNNSNTSVTIDRIITTVYMYSGSGWVQLGASKPSSTGYTIMANQRNEITIEPQVSLTEAFLNNFSMILSNPLDLINQKFKAKIQVHKAGKLVAEEQAYVPSSGANLNGMNLV